jgi:hypothetical protein
MAKATRASGLAVVAACGAAFLAPGVTYAGVPDFTQNWSGYTSAGPAFVAVSGGWRQPAADCLSNAAGATGASFWVGLGGQLERSHKIEQIGTSADCNADGTTSAYGWYELWPAAPVTVRLDVRAGDKIFATVTIRGGKVSFGLADTTTEQAYRRTLTVGRPDTSSADWIAEAPRESMHDQRSVPLTDFGSVAFTDASATASDGHKGAISDPNWGTTVEEMRSGTDRPRNAMELFVDQVTAVHIVPGALSHDGRGFSVTWARGPGATASSHPGPAPGAM